MRADEVTESLVSLYNHFRYRHRKVPKAALKPSRKPLAATSRTDFSADIKHFDSKQMDLYLTSPDWTDFAQSRQILNIDRIKIGMFSYFLVTLTEPITFNNTKHHRLLLTSPLHFVRSNYESRLPLSFNVFTIKLDYQNKITCGVCIGKEVDLHTKNQ